MRQSPVMCLDVGTRRIGVAVTDPDAMLAMPWRTVDAKPKPQGVREIVEELTRRDIHTLVVGWPLSMDGSEGAATRRVSTYLDDLKAVVPAEYDLEIVLWDERLTTTAAEATLIGADVSRRKRKGVVDQIAATYILEAYLNSRRTHG